MKFLTKRLTTLGLALLCSVPSLAAVTHKTTSKGASQKSAASASANRSAAKKAPPRKAAPAKKVAPHASTSSTCHKVRVKTSKGWVNRRVCKGGSSEAAPGATLRSPIRGNALDAPPAPDRPGEVKARTVPSRAYAVDGQTFFYQGRKYRVAGLKGNDNSDMAKQRLQRALESGDISLDPAQAEEGGVTAARVRINGRNIADDLN